MKLELWYRCSECGHESGQPRRHQNKSGHGSYRAIRWSEPYDYRSAHRLVHAVRGRPGEQTCVCGKVAHGWALKPELHAFRELRWSVDPNDYVALCQMCHKHQDWPEDEWRAAAIKARSAAGVRGGNALRARRNEDPALDAKILKTISDNGKRLIADPEHVAKMQAGIQRKRETDPEFNERYIESKRRAGRISAERRRERENQ